MGTHFNLTNEQFESAFETNILDPQLFTHEAHLRLAWIHIHNYGIDTAIKNINSQLINYTRHLGADDKYNETVTVAAVKAVYHFMLKSKSTNFKGFILEFPKLKFYF